MKYLSLCFRLASRSTPSSPNLSQEKCTFNRELLRLNPHFSSHFRSRDAGDVDVEQAREKYRIRKQRKKIVEEMLDVWENWKWVNRSL